MQFGFRTESRTLDAGARASTTGEFVALPDGFVHYELNGPPDGEVVVLVHGFSVPYYIWDPTFDALAQAGFRVLRYDLYGRGYSDRPRIHYNQDLYDRQLYNLIQALRLQTPLNLVGLSMGGLITVVFTDRHPDLVRRFCLVDPLCAPVEVIMGQRLLRLPGIGDIIMNVFGDRVVTRKGKNFHRPERFPDYAAKYYPQLQYKGFRHAILSTIRYTLHSDMNGPYGRVGALNHKAMLIWGREDRVIPLPLHTIVTRLIPHIEPHIIDETGHIPHYERPDVVNPILIDFLKR